MAQILRRQLGGQHVEPSRPPALLPFSAVLKSREVEDPVNLWLHRPLAYGFVSVIYRTAITPNQVTFVAMTVGLLAASCWFIGGSTAMVVGGVLLWLSAILDGADGILARARRVSSPAGRALDGLADLVVGVATSAAALWHMTETSDLPVQVVLVTGIVAVVCTVFHMNLYDLYKELFLRSTRRSGGEGHDAQVMEREKAAPALQRAPWHVRLAMNFYADYLAKQERFTARTNDVGARLLRLPLAPTEHSARMYRAHNAAPMKLWIAISLAPHSYLFAIAGMFDLLLPYMIARLTVMNGLALIALVLQRRASRATYRDYAASGLLPSEPATARAQS
jgi:phosphatidylglycerophosphate synthase